MEASQIQFTKFKEWLDEIATIDSDSNITDAQYNELLKDLGITHTDLERLEKLSAQEQKETIESYLQHFSSKSGTQKWETEMQQLLRDNQQQYTEWLKHDSKFMNQIMKKLGLDPSEGIGVAAMKKMATNVMSMLGMGGGPFENQEDKERSTAIHKGGNESLAKSLNPDLVNFKSWIISKLIGGVMELFHIGSGNTAGSLMVVMYQMKPVITAFKLIKGQFATDDAAGMMKNFNDDLQLNSENAGILLKAFSALKGKMKDTVENMLYKSKDFKTLMSKLDQAMSSSKFNHNEKELLCTFRGDIQRVSDGITLTAAIHQATSNMMSCDTGKSLSCSTQSAKSTPKTNTPGDIAVY